MVHRNGLRTRLLVMVAGMLVMLVFAGLPSLAPIAAAQAQAGTVKLEWFGWSFFRFTSPRGKIILTNPFITGNPDAAVKVDDITRADLILVPNGHRDEIGDTVAIAKKTSAKTVSPFELGAWFISKGVPEAQVQRRNPGSRFVWEGITIRVVGSVHGSGSGQPVDSDVAPIYGGAAAGFMITFENAGRSTSPAAPRRRKTWRSGGPNTSPMP